MRRGIEQAVHILFNGGVILYPTDTVWGIGCSALSEKAIGKIYEIKQRSESKSMIVLVDTIERLREYVEELPSFAVEMIRNAQKPLTIIYPKAKNLPSSIVAQDGSIAIRLVDHAFCQKVIAQIDAPLVSTSANISGEPTPVSFDEISARILSQMDLVVDRGFDTAKNTQPSTIIKMIDENQFEVIRP